MKHNPHSIKIVKPKLASLTKAALAFTCALLCCQVAHAQTLQLKYTFEDGPGNTTTDDPSSAIYPLSMSMISSSGAVGDLHGGANSGIQNLGASLNLSTNPIAGNAAGSFAMVTNSSALGAIGVVTGFTATVWVKMPNLETNFSNQGSRIYCMMGTGISDIGGANSLGFQPQLTSGATQLFPKVVMRGVVGTTFLTPAIYYDFPTNEWLFFALTYDNVSGNACLYYGTEASPAKLYAVKGIGAGINFDFSGTPSFTLGDRPSKGRSFPGWIDDARFYVGAGDANFIENIRQSGTPLVVSSLSPDGSVLQAGTSTLSFTATSTNGVNTSGVKVSVNGTDVSSGLLFSPTTGGQMVVYTNLPVNPTLIQQANLNGVSVNIRVTDASGIVTSNSYVYDAFSPTNFTWECEDYDFGGGLFIDNPVMTFVGPNTNTYYQEQTAYENTIDANDNGNVSGPNRVYRDPFENVETEYSLGGGGNGGQSIGELMRQKVLNAYAETNIARDVNVGYFDGGTGSGLPNWMNYTRTFPNGNYNVFLRVADGAGNLNTPLDLLTSGWGTTTQTTTNEGVFNIANTGGWDSFAWVPLRDSSGNLARVQLNGTNTLRLTAGGGNLNFVMLIPANTNLPTIGNLYPNGTNMFQPAAALTFVASSPAGVAIKTNSVTVRLAVTNLLGQGFVTNLTATNGLSFSGQSTNWSVSVPLASNNIYSATISVTDNNGSPAGTTVAFDTLSPVYTWEAPDYDYNGGQFLPDPIAVDGYMNLAGISGIDFNYPNNPSSGDTYRDIGSVGVENNGDSPQRLQYLTNNPAPQPYDMGYYNGGNWLNYTRAYPAGTYNIFIRAADGSTGGALGNVGISVLTNGWGTATQGTTNLGSFNIPVTGGWQTYTWVPLRDGNGNLAKFVSDGSTNTLKATSNGSQNAFFYALFPANTNLPALGNVFPAAGSQLTNTFSFTVQSSAGVTSNNVVVTVNGVTVSNLVFTGTINNWTVKYPHLAPNSTYVVTVTVTDSNGNSSTSTSTFDTMNPGNYTWEAEDFDHDSGQFIDNPQTNAYNGLGAVTGVDAVQVNFNANGQDLYRASGSFTAVNGDVVRPQYQDPANPQSDYEIGYFSDGAWANYTRHYPAGTYNIYGRAATASATGTDALLAEVTDGWGTTTQNTNLLGTFNIPNTGGWETYQFVPLRDAGGNLVNVTFDGSTNTLQLIRPTDNPASADVNFNYMMLVPVLQTTATESGTNLVVTFPTLTGFNYQLVYKANLTDPSWVPVGSPLPGNGASQSVTNPITGTSRFYRLQVQ